MIQRIGPVLLLMMIVSNLNVQRPIMLYARLDRHAAVARASLPTPPRPPEQPAVGPGGTATKYQAVQASRYGAPPTGYWLFTPIANGDNAPADDTDRSLTLPITIFLHGFTAVDPIVYRAWIDHIVLRGAIVVYPDYQLVNPFGADWDTFLPNTLAAIDSAIARLTDDRPGSTDELQIAAVGHSLGAVLAVGYAAAASDQGLPLPAAVMAIQPGGCQTCAEIPGGEGVSLPNLDKIDPATSAIVVVGEDDSVVGDEPAKKIWSELASIPLDQRDYVTLRSDNHGLPPLRATHLQPQTARFGGTVDALDWYGTWKLFDLLADCAFFAIHCDHALGNTEQQRFMGRWSDGTHVVAPRITDFPGLSTR